MSESKNIPLVQVLANALMKSSFDPKLEAWVNDLHEKISSFMQANPNLLSDLRHFLDDFKNLPARQKEVWSKAASLGWYMNFESSISMKHYVGLGQQALNSYMEKEIQADWITLTTSIIAAYPARAEILTCAFELHNEGRYIASIPLFFAQADGICDQNLDAHLFADGEKRKLAIVERSRNAEPFTDVLLELLQIKTPFNARISKYEAKDKLRAPNRNCILHGSCNHLDYGTEINSLKAFSLLAFVVLVFSKESLIQ